MYVSPVCLFANEYVSPVCLFANEYVSPVCLFANEYAFYTIVYCMMKLTTAE